MMADLNRVAEVVLVQEGDEIKGMELVFTTSVRTRNGGAMVLNELGARLRDTGWTFNTLARVQDAQVDEGASEGGDPESEGDAGEAETTETEGNS